MSAYTVAEKLLHNGTAEDEYRAAASRAYFAAFQCVIRHARDMTFEDKKSGEVHRDLIDFLKRQKREPERIIGIRLLPRLRALRNQADYELDIEFARDDAEEALDYSLDIRACTSL